METVINTSYFVALMTTFLTTIGVGAVARVLLRGFGSRSAQFGALCVTSGYVIGAIAYLSVPERRPWLAVVAIAGWILALGVMWAWLREKGNSDPLGPSQH